MTSNNTTNNVASAFPIPIASGGTGQTSQTAAFNALSPLTTKGDLISFDGTNNVRVAVGSDGKILTSSSGASSGVAYATTTSNPTILSSSVVLTSAQVKALRATPITILSAQGAGTISIPFFTILKMTYGGNNAFTNPQNMRMRFTNASGGLASANIAGSGFIDQTANKYILATISSAAALTASSSENAAIVLTNAGASEITGNASNDNTLTVVILYKILTL